MSKWPRWAACLLPLAAGTVIAALVTDARVLSNPVLYVRADLGTLAMLVGFLASALLAGGVALWTWAERQSNRRVDGVSVRAAEERRRFLQRLDHELKNPLTAIRAGLANVVSGSATAAQLAALSSVEAQVLRLSRLTADLRKLAELETRPLERVPIDVPELLEEVMAVAREQPQAPERRLSLTLRQVPWPVPDVPGDWDMLFLAAYNLVGNALKFTRPDDAIEVRAYEDGASVVIEVADGGPGIPEEELDRVWEELYRGHGARGIPGSGLGLALVRAIVERHGGSVRMRSRLEQGTVVTMRLPVR
jgi:two-component system OmpR family sensor kinase